MIRLEEFQVAVYGVDRPSRGIGEVASSLGRSMEGSFPLSDEEKEETAEDLGDMLLYVAKVAERIGYTLGEVAEIAVGNIRDKAYETD